METNCSFLNIARTNKAETGGQAHINPGAGIITSIRACCHTSSISITADKLNCAKMYLVTFACFLDSKIVKRNIDKVTKELTYKVQLEVVSA